MATETSLGRYKDRNAVFLKNDVMRVCFLPEDGGKIASLVDCRSQREFLVQGKSDRYLPLVFGHDYVESDCSGFDDLFPTVDEGYSECPPWNGVPLADHGEVCALPWHCIVRQDRIELSVHGVRFPYRLYKTACFQDGALRIDYRCDNLSGFDMDVLWAAHLMVRAEERGRILSPFQESAQVECVFSRDARFAHCGDILTWPSGGSWASEGRRMDTTPPMDPQGNNCKFYFREQVPEGDWGYAYPDGSRLLVGFDPVLVPYMGIWVNEGSFRNELGVALEPCTGTHDRPDRAIRRGQCRILPANGSLDWWVSIKVEKTKEGRSNEGEPT